MTATMHWDADRLGLHPDSLQSGGASLRIHLLGTFRVAVAGQEIDPAAWRLRKASHLVKLLALAPDRRLHREQVLEHLWPDLAPDAAANNLRVTVHFVRKLINERTNDEAPTLRLCGEQIQLLPNQPVWTDVAAFEDAAASARASDDPAAFVAALDLYTGDLLPDDPFEEWASERRHALRMTFVTLLNDLSLVYERRGDLDEAIHTLERLIETDPSNEYAHRDLMRLYARSGLRVQALRQYQQLRNSLQRELDVEPEPVSTQLYEAILIGTFRHDIPNRVVDHSPPPATSSRLDFPAAQGATNLPVLLTSFIGREQEIKAVHRILAGTRLLTLVGPGGSGKTRLAIEAARDLTERYPDGVWLVELDGLRDPILVPQAVATVLGIREAAGRSLLDVVTNGLRDKRLLLILDNCEHLIEASAELVTALLQECHWLTVLTTSREALRVDGETIWPVPALEVPGEQYIAGIDTLRHTEAVELFCERARLVRPDFDLVDTNARAIARICARLEGMPLAIELAATRVRGLSVDQIVERLDEPLRFLNSGNRRRPSRQRSLRSAIEWSHDLLSEQQQHLFRSLAVFSGSFSLEAVESVYSDDNISKETVLDLLLHLIDKSLVAVSEQHGQVRYRLLEPIRQYAQQQLVDSKELSSIRDRHLNWMVALATRAEPALSAAGQDVWLDRLESEHDNLRAALAWAIETRDADRGLDLGWRLWRFWSIRGHFMEGRRWLDQLLDLPITPSISQGEALFGAGRLAYLQGDTGAARIRFEQCLVIAEAAEYDELKAGIYTQLGHILFREGNYDAARAYYENGLRIRQATPAQQENADQWYLGVSLTGIGKAALALGDYIEARSRLEESLDQYRQVGDNVEIARTLSYLGQAVHLSGDLTRARQLQEQSLDLARSLDNQRVAADALTQLGYIAIDQGDIRVAQASFTDASTVWTGLGIQTGVIECLEGLARLAADQQQYQDAIRIAAAACSARAASGELALPYLRELLVRSLEPAYRAIGDRAAALEDEGRAMTLDQAIALAIQAN